MNYVWNIDGIKVGSVSTNRWEGQQLWTSGFGVLERPTVPTVGMTTIFQWEITALQHGWYVIITTAVGKRGEVQGTTFNAPLEIASAARRVL